VIDSWVGAASVKRKLAPGYCGSKDQVMVKLWLLNACGCGGPLGRHTNRSGERDAGFLQELRREKKCFVFSNR